MFTAHKGGIQQIGISEDDYLEIAAQGLLQCIIGIGLAGKASGVGLGSLLQIHIMELFRRFSAPNGTIQNTITNESPDGDLPSQESFELWRETYGAYFGMSNINYDQWINGVSQSEIRYDLESPPDYLVGLAKINHEYAMMVIKGMAEIMSAFVVTTPFKSERIATLHDYKERWFAVSAMVLGARYINDQFIE